MPATLHDRTAPPAPPLRALVECRDGVGSWAESCDLDGATPHGATLSLTCQPQLGQLLKLTLPPRGGSSRGAASALLADDESTTLWALVWALTEGAAASPDDAQRYSVSVMFVDEEAAGQSGPEAAAGYAYEFESSGEFRLREQSEEHEAPAAQNSAAPPPARTPAPPIDNGAAAQSKPAQASTAADDDRLRRLEEAVAARADTGRDRRRSGTRLILPVEVTVEALDPSGAVTAREQTVTENISRRGAAVWTTLALAAGARVRLKGERCGVTVTSVVRARRVGPDGIARLHLEHLDGEWPLDGIG